MPWSIVEGHSECGDDQWAVVKDDDGEVVGCHDSLSDAESQLAALNAAEDDDSDNSTPSDMRIVRARIRTLPQDAARQLPAYDFGDAEPYIFGAEISSNRLDAYYTYMDPDTTLRNYRDDAKTGVSFLDSHDARKLGMGQTFDAVLEDDGDAVRVMADIYTVPGLRFGGQHSFASTDDFIRAVRAGVVRDVSVGFYDGEEICDMCGEPVWGWTDCPHLPGVEYEIGEQGEQTVMATATIYDAHLAEVSAVYDGATPGAMIQKARALAMSGRLPDYAIPQVERRYHVRLPDRKLSYSVRKDVRMSQDTKPDSAPADDALAPVRAILTELDRPADEELADTVRWLVGEVSRLAPLEDEVDRLRPLADDGHAYRTDLIEQALAEGVRALGEDFPAETYRGMLEAAGIDHIKAVRDSFAERAAGRFPGGRHTVDGDETPETETEDVEPELSAPDEVYAG